MSTGRVCGLLLTGGTSRRMGSDKVALRLGGGTLARRGAESLMAVADTCLVIGHEAGTGLDAVDDPGSGPLVALVSGADELAGRGHTGAALLLAADMPFVTPALLRLLAGRLGDADAALPVAGGRDQPLCACYSPAAIATARRLVARGRRAMHELVGALGDIVRIGEDEWRELAPPYALLDVDTPADYEEAKRILEPPA